MSRQATHRGTCQACGRIQKLPGGIMSLHGYTKQWGFFHGTCRGSHHKPFELSKDLIDTCIQGAQNAITSLQVQRGDLVRMPTSETKAWMKIYVGHKHDGKNSYAWKKGTITLVTREYHGTGLRITEYVWTSELSDVEIAQERKPMTETLHTYELPGVRDVVGAIEQLNYKYVLAVIDPESKQLRTYIAWQQQRIKDWSPKPLRPLTEK
jgi:hypothetical protein